MYGHAHTRTHMHTHATVFTDEKMFSVEPHLNTCNDVVWDEPSARPV